MLTMRSAATATNDERLMREEVLVMVAATNSRLAFKYFDGTW